jgi:hypothetical protein
MAAARDELTRHVGAVNAAAEAPPRLSISWPGITGQPATGPDWSIELAPPPEAKPKIRR